MSKFTASYLREKKKRKKEYQKWYYENKTKVNRNLAKQWLSIHNGTVFKHEYLNGWEITVKDVSNKPIPPDTI